MENNVENTGHVFNSTILPANNITFVLGQPDPILRLEANGDIYVRGKLTTNDIDVVDALRDFLRGQKYHI